MVALGGLLGGLHRRLAVLILEEKRAMVLHGQEGRGQEDNAAFKPSTEGTSSYLDTGEGSTGKPSW